VYVYQPTSYAVYYKTPITTLQKEFVGEVGYSGIPTDFVAQGYVRSVHGNRVAGVTVHATFYISGWLGSATREADATSTDCWADYGKFIDICGLGPCGTTTSNTSSLTSQAFQMAIRTALEYSIGSRSLRSISPFLSQLSMLINVLTVNGCRTFKTTLKGFLCF
jgi:hypothetical protein